jgi:hypothetical protein
MGPFGTALAVASATALAGVMGNYAGRGIGMVEDKVTFQRDFDSMVAKSPSMRNYSRQDVLDAFSSVRHMNAHITKDPLAAGAAVEALLRNRNPQDPSAPPRMDLVMAKTLAETAKARAEGDPHKEIRQLGQRAAEVGVQAGLKVYETEKSLARAREEEPRAYQLGLARKREEIEYTEGRARAKEEAANQQKYRDIAQAMAAKHRALTGQSLTAANIHTVPNDNLWSSRPLNGAKPSVAANAIIQRGANAVKEYANLSPSEREQVHKYL